MKKRWSDFLRTRLSLLLTVVLVLALLPLSALAADDTPALPAGWPETSWADAEGVKEQSFEEKPTTLTNYELVTMASTGAVQRETVTIDSSAELGTRENPIAISTPEELILFGQLTETNDKYYILTASEYDMSGRYMIPLFPASPGDTGGMRGVSFSGTLIGNGSTITGARIQTFHNDNNQKYLGGLFGAIHGNISDLTVKDSTILLSDGRVMAGGLAGYMAGGYCVDCHVENVSFLNPSGENGYNSLFGGLFGECISGTISDCTAQVTGDIAARGAEIYVGGLVGYAYDAKITDCTATVDGDIIANATWNDAYAGGLAGYFSDEMTDCTATVNGSITATATQYNDADAGGLAGYFSGEMTNCTATVNGSIAADVTGDSGSATAGGLVGEFSGEMTNCTATVEGGITASAEGSWNAYAGGLVGYNGSYNVTSTITGCNAKAQTGLNGPLGAVGRNYSDSETIADTNSTTLLLGSGGMSVTLKGEDKAGSVSEEGEKLIMTFDTSHTNDVVITGINGVKRIIPAGEAFTVSSDGTVTSNGSTMYPVTFDSQGGSDVQGVYTTDGGKVTKPDDPTRQGFNFTGWYTDSACAAGSLWNFETGTVTAPLTLYAGWEELPEPEPEPGWDPEPDPTYRPDVERTEGGTVETRPANPTEGSLVTITPKPDRGYEVDEVTVTDRNGDPVEVTRREDGTYTFRQPRGRVTIRVTYRPVETAWVNPFTDVTRGDWYYDAVEYVQKNGLMAGTSDTTFEPDLTTSRGMVVTILWRLAGSPDMEDGIWGYPFADVDAGAYYGTAVYWARRNGIAGGYSDESFGPNDPITREQLAVMLYNYAGRPPVPNLALMFSDADQVSDFADSAIRWAVDAGIIGGRDNGILDPRGRATRAEAAAMLMRFCENIAG